MSDRIFSKVFAALLAGSAVIGGCAPATGSEGQASASMHQPLSAQLKPHVATGRNHSMALLNDGTVWAWGYNYDGQLGDGSTTDKLSPVRVSGFPIANNSVQSIWAGAYYSLALLSDGTVRAWGSNSSGQLGDGTLHKRTTPVTVMKTTSEALSGVVALAAGYSHTLALDSQGMVWAWGNNYSGQLGDGSTTSYKTAPVRVMKSTGEVLSGVVGIAAGREHSVAVLSDGTVWAWGANSQGQLGDGTTSGRRTPVQVMKSATEVLSYAVEVGAGEYFSQALLSDGSVRSWGDNYSGQLGDGTKTDSVYPVVASNLSGASFVDGSDNGDYFSVALMPSTGEVRAWGIDNCGQLGNGQSSGSLTPTSVDISGVQSLSASAMFALARKGDGSIWFWGFNSRGQAGDGTSSGCYISPTQVLFP